MELFRRQDGGVKVVTNGEVQNFDYLVMAVPFDVLGRMLRDAPSEAEIGDTLAVALGKLSTSPITGIHLWFDREISELDHAVLLDRTIQWMFHKSRILESRNQQSGNQASRASGSQEKGSGSYVELVVSCSRSLVEKSKAEIVEMAVKELKEFFPGSREATLVKSTVIKEVHATYSPAPGVDQFRPRAATAWPRVFLAGDYTATGWPATMEGAVRSGYLAAEALARSAGRDCSFLAPDLPSAGLMRLFG